MSDTITLKRHRQPWLPEEEKRLAHLWHGEIPLAQLSKIFQRTEAALLQRVAQMEHKATIYENKKLMTIGEFAYAFGINRQAARFFVDGKPWAKIVYRRNAWCWLIHRPQLLQWLENPLNWLDFDETKINDTIMQRIIKKALASNKDRWLTIKQCAELAPWSYWGIHKAVVQSGRLPSSRGTKGMTGNKLHLIKMSDLQQFIATGGNWKRYTK